MSYYHSNSNQQIRSSRSDSVSSSQRRPSTVKLSKSDFELFQKKLADQMRLHVSIQSDLLKSVSAYKEAVENLARTSDNLAHQVGKLAVYTMNAFQINQEYHSLTQSPMPAESESKQKNLRLALQQVVKFHTIMAQEQSAVSISLSADFERPLLGNLEKFRDIAQNWDKSIDKELRHIQSEIKQKEQQATKQGKKQGSDLGKLQSSLHELSMKVNELESKKFSLLDSAITTDQYQSMLVAHHLQRVLKAEIGACRSVYHQDGITKSQLSTPQRQALSPPVISHHQNNGNHSNDRHDRNRVESNGDNFTPIPPPRKSSELLSISEGELSSQIASSKLMPPAPLNPHRRTIIAPPTANIDVLEKIIEKNFGSPKAISRVPSKEQVITDSKENYTQNQPENELERKKSSRKSSRMTEFYAKPSEDAYTIKYIDNSEPHKDETSKFVVDRRMMQSLYSQPGDFQLSPRRQSNYTDENRESSHFNISDGDQMGGENIKESDLVLVIYDFIGTADDDLNVIEGDVLKAMAVEGEWIYAVLMIQTGDGEFDYEPAVVNDQLQAGWIPMTFIARL